MIVGLEMKPSLDELELRHHGVKGMRWGVRKKVEPANAAYTQRMRANDKRQHGSRAVNRINRRLNEGETRNKALDRERTRNNRQALAAIGSVYALAFMADYGGVSTSSMRSFVSQKAEANRAAAKNVDSVLGLASKADPLKYVKPNRQGVHKITTLK